LEFAVVYMSLMQKEADVELEDDDDDDEDGPVPGPSQSQGRHPRHSQFRFGPIKGNELLAWRVEQHTFDRRDYALTFVLDLAVRSTERTLKSDFVAMVQLAAATAAAAAARARARPAAVGGTMRQEDHTAKEVHCLNAINADLLCALMREVIDSVSQDAHDGSDDKGKKKASKGVPQQAHGASSGFSSSQLVYRGVLGTIRSEIATATALMSVLSPSPSSSSSSSSSSAASGGSKKDAVNCDPAVSEKVGTMVVTTLSRVGLTPRDDGDDGGSGTGGNWTMTQLKNLSKNFSKLLMQTHKKAGAAAAKEACPVLVAILGEVRPRPSCVATTLRPIHLTMH